MSTWPPDDIRVTEHAIDRYLERRSTTLSRDEVPDKILELLGRYDGPMPLVHLHADGRLGRRFVVGELALITDADITAVVTLVRTAATPQRRRRKLRNNRRT